jgi:hypothetical protein
MKRYWLITGLLLAGCTGDEGNTTSDPKNDVPLQVKPVKKLSLSDLTKAAEEVALVPSPAEMQRSLVNAGLKSDLASLVSKDRLIEMNVENKDNLAVRTGVVLADLVLTIKDSTKEEKIERLSKLKVGFKSLGGGEDIQSTIDELISGIKSDAMSADDLLKDMDELSGVMVPELEYEAGDWVVPLIQAGSWLEGANLVSSAIIAENKFETASQLLRQPRVVEYFLSYVEREGREKVPDQVVEKLITVLKKLKTISNKKILTADDIKDINQSTSEVLSML